MADRRDDVAYRKPEDYEPQHLLDAGLRLSRGSMGSTSGMRRPQALFELAPIERAMVGLEITRARRTHGSMIWLDFGPLVVTRIDKRGRALHGGTFTMIVEKCAWKLRSGRSIWLRASDDRRLIENRISSLAGSRVRSVRLGIPGSLIRLSGGRSLRLPVEEPKRSDLYHWMLFKGNEHLVTLDQHGNYDWNS